MKEYAAIAATVSFSAAALVSCGGDYRCNDTTLVDVARINDVRTDDPRSLTEAVDRLDELADQAPAEIKDDLETARDTFRQIAEANGDPQALREIDTAALSEADQNLQHWEHDNSPC